jgi:hypothetical protein
VFSVSKLDKIYADIRLEVSFQLKNAIEDKGGHKAKRVKVTRSAPILAHWGRGGIAPTLS